MPPTADPYLIHTILPADVENAPPGGSQGEFFMATVNPTTSSGSWCVPSNGNPCYSNQLAYWTWAEIQQYTTEVPSAGYTPITVNQFIPGCYDWNGTVADTYCVPQPTVTNTLDSVGDRLSGSLAYRYITGCDDGSASYPTCEYMAVTQTVQVGTALGSQTGIRYYTLVAMPTTPAPPSVAYQETIQDNSGNDIYYFASSNAIDKNEDVGYTFSVGNGNTSNYPSIYADRLDSGGNKGTVTLATAGTGSMLDICNKHWGEYVSTSIDPSDDLTFWSVGEYLFNDVRTCHGAEYTCGTHDYSDCGLSTVGWRTEAFTCTEGSGLCP